MNDPETPSASPPDRGRLRRLLSPPRLDDATLGATVREALGRQPVPVIWLLGKTQSGKTSIIRALTGSTAAEIGSGFRPCTRTARFFDFPPEAPVVRFLDTRGLGELDYDPAEDIRFCEDQAHLVLGVLKATDLEQEAIFAVLRAVRARHPAWPVLIAQTGLHEGYPHGAGHPLPYPYDREPWPAAVPADLGRLLLAQRGSLGPLPGLAPPRWVPIDLTQPGDGLDPPDYGLVPLWETIGEFSSLNLHARLCADPAVRDRFARAAHPHIVGHALAAAALGALPLVDLAGVPAVQAKLLHALAGLYGQGWGGREWAEFASLLGLAVGAGYGLRLAGRNLLKLVPVLGQTAGALYGAASAGATTYALGKAAAYYFERRRLGERIDPAALRALYAQALTAGGDLIRQADGKDGPDHERR